MHDENREAMSNNGLTPIMTRLRMTSLRESGGERGDEHADDDGE